MVKTRIITIFLAAMLLIQSFPLRTFAVQSNFDGVDLQKSGFILVTKQNLAAKNATVYYLKHKKSGANVFYFDDGKEEKTFSIGFRTPPNDNKGANHVLEHSLMCGSEKYPSKNLDSYLRSNSVATLINAFTIDDSTSYAFKTSNKTDFYNLADVYINAVLNPSILTEENIFKQQGIRREYSGGKVVYNGVVYNELRLNNLQTKNNTINFVAGKLYTNLYNNTVPTFNSGGNVDAIAGLKYSDVLSVYKKYYTLSNSLICISGNQDISHTLNFLNSYLKNYSTKDLNITWNYLAAKPKSLIQSYNVTNKTTMVDIGFLCSGPAVTKVRESYAYEVLMTIIQKRMSISYPNIYTVGGSNGGISNLGIIISDVAASQKEKVIFKCKSVLLSLKQDGISTSELNSAIEQVESSKNDCNVTQVSDLALKGFVYGSNPFLFLNIAADFQYLKDNPLYFKEILSRYFINNQYKNIVVSGHTLKTADSNEIKVSASELAKIKKETEAFSTWAETPDTSETLAKLPVLSLDDFKEGKLDKKAGQTEKMEISNGVSYYATLDNSAKTADVNMCFELPELKVDLKYAAIMTQYLNYKFSSIGLDNVSCLLSPDEKFSDENAISPRFIISISYDKKTIAETTQKITGLISENGLFSTEELAKFLKQENDKSRMLSSTPYFISYDMMASSENQADKFRTATLGSSQAGSIFYFNFIKRILQTPNEYNSCASRLKSIFEDTINRNGLIVSYYGNNAGYNTFKSVFDPFVTCMNSKVCPVYSDKMQSSYNSAVILSDKQDVSHIMQAGNIYKSGYRYSGKMEVLANLLTSKYLTPVLRGKMGAYGASASFTNGKIIFSVAGISDIDKALKVFAESGDYLRSLSMTQKELDSIIISTLNQFDQYYNADNYRFEQKPLIGCTIDDWKKIRQDILSTTVDDIKNYAGFIDAMTAQKSVFAVTNSETAAKAAFPFECSVNSSDFTVTPILNKNRTNLNLVSYAI